MFQLFKQKSLDEQLKKQKRATEEEDAKRRAKQVGLPYLDLISSKISTELKAMQIVGEEEAKKALLSPLQLFKNKLSIALFDPRIKEASLILEKLKEKYALSIFVCSKTSLEHAWSYYGYLNEEKEISGNVEIDEENLKRILSEILSLDSLSKEIKNFKSHYTSKILEIILAGGLAMKASDIHLEPAKDKNIMRLRIDGILHSVYEDFSIGVYKSVITRIKLLSNLKLNIHNVPQDGRFTIKLKEKDIEVRTSIIPSEYGETAVLRLLDPTSLKANLEDLGWRKDDLEIVKKVIRNPNGLILNTGPTGSGKTTTLYAFLQFIRKPEIKIITIEDPIEYHIQGISQTQVDSDANYTFASGLRSILRQDPNIVLVGEIRDKETAEIAMNASLTGHLVFSTLHTNDAVGSIPRLIDLGAKPQILGPSIKLVIAQRLVRVLCNNCKEKIEIEKSEEEKIKRFLENLPERVSKDDFKDFGLWKSRGCSSCGMLGYRGRVSVFELFFVSRKIEELIYKNPTEIELKEASRNDGMVLMQEDAILKALKGITSIDEVERLTGRIEWFEK